MVSIFLFSQDIKYKIFYQLMTLYLSGYLILFTISVFSVLCNEYEVAVKKKWCKTPSGSSIKWNIVWDFWNTSTKFISSFQIDVLLALTLKDIASCTHVWWKIEVG